MTMLATSVTTVLYVTVYIRNGIFIGKNMILVDQHPLHYLYFHAADWAVKGVKFVAENTPVYEKKTAHFT